MKEKCDHSLTRLETGQYHCVDCDKKFEKKQRKTSPGVIVYLIAILIACTGAGFLMFRYMFTDSFENALTWGSIMGTVATIACYVLTRNFDLEEVKQ